MSITLLTGGNIANIELVKIVTDETSARTLYFNTASSATFSPNVSSGTEKELRIKNTLHGLLRTDDLVKGYDVELSDQKLLFDIMALVDGGTVTTAETGGLKTYTAPVAGQPVSRIKFDLYLYTSDRDTDGDVNKYHEWKFPACKGKPISGSMQDDDFSTMKYTIQSRPAAGSSPLSISEVSALPST